MHPCPKGERTEDLLHFGRWMSRSKRQTHESEEEKEMESNECAICRLSRSSCCSD